MDFVSKVESIPSIVPETSLASWAELVVDMDSTDPEERVKDIGYKWPKKRASNLLKEIKSNKKKTQKSTKKRVQRKRKISKVTKSSNGKKSVNAKKKAKK